MSGFNARLWLERWLKVGGVYTGPGGRVFLVMDLDGNAATQRRLLAKLEACGRRDEVRDAALRRWRGPG